MELRYSGIAWALLLCLALAGNPALAQTPALGSDIASLLDYARSHNPALQAERAEALAAHERIEPAGALPDPSFEIERMDASNANQGGETRYRVNQPLPFWGKRDLNTRAAAARASKADALTSAAWLTLAAQLNAAWLRYWAAERSAALNRDALALLRGLEDTTLARYRLGLVPQQAVLRAQREITAQRLAQVAVGQRRQTAVATVNALLARPTGSALAAPSDPPALPEAPALAKLLEHANHANPSLAAEALGVDVARLERDRTLRERYPDVTLGLRNNQPREGEPSWDLILEVMIPLQQSARRAREREAEALVTAADARRAAEEAKHLNELAAAHAAFVAGRDSLRMLSGSLLPQAQATLDATRAAFSSGRVDFDTMIEAERQLIEIRMKALEAEVDTRMALAELEKLAGEMQ